MIDVFEFSFIPLKSLHNYFILSYTLNKVMLKLEKCLFKHRKGCINENSSLFKLFMADVGILTTLYGKAAKAQLLSGRGEINFGAVYENAAAQELKAHGLTLYYYNSKKFGELDFVTEYRGRVLPIGIKSGKDYKRHSVLSNVMGTSNYAIEEAFVFTNYNVEVKDKYIYYPIYMLMFLNDEYIQLPAVDIFDLAKLSE